MKKKAFGLGIKKYRELSRISQLEMAERMGVTQQTVSSWERGMSYPDVEAIEKICEILQIREDELFEEGRRMGAMQHSMNPNLIALFIIGFIMIAGTISIIVTNAVNKNRTATDPTQKIATFADELPHYRIVDGAQSGQLVLADEYSCYTLDATTTLTIYYNGEQSDYSCLTDGMEVYVSASEIQEMYPSNILPEGSVLYAYENGYYHNIDDITYDYCGLYLRVLDDLWNAMPPFQENLDTVILDLLASPELVTGPNQRGLTKGEMAAIGWIFGNQHNVYVSVLSEEPLDEAKLEVGSNQYWNCLWMRIEGDHNPVPDPYTTFYFEAISRRGPGYYMKLVSCSAKWMEEGKWKGDMYSYEIRETPTR